MSEIDRQAFDLNRFLDAQESNYREALVELRAGQKRSHWSWYVFPQVQGLGASAMSVRYGLPGIVEARAYLEHSVLGARLKETVAALLAHHGSSATKILGEVDAQKLQSCLTLFNLAANDEPLFQAALNKYFYGEQDANTLAIIAGKTEQD